MEAAAAAVYAVGSHIVQKTSSDREDISDLIAESVNKDRIIYDLRRENKEKERDKLIEDLWRENKEKREKCIEDLRREYIEKEREKFIEDLRRENKEKEREKLIEDLRRENIEKESEIERLRKRLRKRRNPGCCIGRQSRDSDDD